MSSRVVWSKVVSAEPETAAEDYIVSSELLKEGETVIQLLARILAGHDLCKIIALPHTVSMAKMFRLAPFLRIAVLSTCDYVMCLIAASEFYCHPDLIS